MSQDPEHTEYPTLRDPLLQTIAKIITRRLEMKKEEEGTYEIVLLVLRELFGANIWQSFRKKR